MARARKNLFSDGTDLFMDIILSKKLAIIHLLHEKCVLFFLVFWFASVFNALIFAIVVATVLFTSHRLVRIDSEPLPLAELFGPPGFILVTLIIAANSDNFFIALHI